MMILKESTYMLLDISIPLGKCSPSLLLRKQEPPFQVRVMKHGGPIDTRILIQEGLTDLELSQLISRRAIVLMLIIKFVKLS